MQETLIGVTVLSSDAESEDLITDIHQFFWVHSVTNSWPHDMMRLNSTSAFLQGRSIEPSSLNIWLSRYVREATYLFVRRLHKDLLNLTFPNCKLKVLTTA
jgi:hypothetical protein